MKNLWQNFLIVILGLYFIVAFIFFTPYYNWQYAKTHGFVKWFLFGEVIATTKAVAWPYFVFFNSDGTASHIIKSLDYANKATVVINKVGPNQQISQADMEQIINYYKKALAESKKANIEWMNQHYPGFGDHYRSEFMRGLELFIQSYEKNDAIDALASQALLKQWGDWYQANIDDIKRSR